MINIRPPKSVHSFVAALVAACAALFFGDGSQPILCRAGDWSQWRGPSGLGKAAGDGEVALKWSSKENVIWRTAVPGRGHSSPVIVGDLIVLTTADESTQTQGLIAFNRETGKQQWITPVSQGGFPAIHQKNTHASSTVASDGKLFFAAFHHHDKIEAFALSKDGKIVWKQDVGAFRPQLYEYGYAASPTLYQGTLIITGNCDTSSWMKALDPATGRILWQQELPKMLVWSSPIVGNVAGRDQLLLSGFEKMSAFDPKNGQLLWSTPCLTVATCGTAVWEGNVTFASGGYPKAETVAVKADGSGQILWKNNVKCYEQSMLVSEGHVYAFSDQGIAYCWEAQTGKERWTKRLRGPVSSSPILVGNHILATNELGTTYVFEATPEEYRGVSQNQLGTDMFATATVLDGRTYLRVGQQDGNGPRQEFLYCIGTAK